MKKVFILCSILLLAGCGKEANKDGGHCDGELVSDYNRAILNCGYGDTVANCKSSLQSFLNKYPGVNCTAAKNSSSSINDVTVAITESYIRGLMEQAGGSSGSGGSSAPSQPSKPVTSFKYGAACSQDVLDDQKGVAKSCGTTLKADSGSYDENIKKLKSCQSAVDKFLGKYEGINCTAINTQTYQTVRLLESDLISTRQDLDSEIKELEELKALIDDQDKKEQKQPDPKKEEQPAPAAAESYV